MQTNRIRIIGGRGWHARAAVRIAAVGGHPTADDVDAAARALAGRVVRTPLLPAPALGPDVWIKAELFQRGGSFKLRGATNRALAMTAEERARGVTTISAGNHAIAAAMVCRTEGIPATIFMPRAASEMKIKATLAQGAHVDLEAADAAHAFALMHEFAEKTGAFVLHPFDDPAVIAGQGTVGAELVEDLPDVNTVVVPVGGGGLISGIALAVKARRPDARVIGVEPINSAALSAGLAAGEPVRPETAAPTIADALTPPTAGVHTIAIASRMVDEVLTLDEDELRAGLQRAYRDAKLACEAGGAAAIAALIAGKVRGDGPTAVVVSGGNIAPADLARLL
jgi:threonine dehydratase